MKAGKASVKKLVISILCLPFFLTGCGKECYNSELKMRAEYEHCMDLGNVYYSDVHRQMIRSFACTTTGNDVYADFYVTIEGKWCRTHNAN